MRKDIFVSSDNTQISLVSSCYLPPDSLAGDYNLHHVCVRACVCRTVFSETTTVTHFG